MSNRGSPRAASRKGSSPGSGENMRSIGWRAGWNSANSCRNTARCVQAFSGCGKTRRVTRRARWRDHRGGLDSERRYHLHDAATSAPSQETCAGRQDRISHVGRTGHFASVRAATASRRPWPIRPAASDAFRRVSGVSFRPAGLPSARATASAPPARARDPMRPLAGRGALRCPASPAAGRRTP